MVRPTTALFVPATTPTALESAPVEAVACRARRGVEHGVGHRDDGAACRRLDAARAARSALELHAKYQAARARWCAAPAPDERCRADQICADDIRRGALDPVHPRACRRTTTARSSCSARRCRDCWKGEEGVTPDKILPRTRLMREGLRLDGAEPTTSPRRRSSAPARSSRRAGSAAGGATGVSSRGSVTSGVSAAAKRPSGLAFDVLQPKPPRV